MIPYYADESVALHHGDCLDVLRTLPDCSVDSIVTDPPYGLGFMGKAWDDLPPGEEWARECLRVLKPGGHLLAFGGTRTWHRLACAVEDAGFEMRDSLAWLHGQGLPKGKGQLKPAFEPVVMGRKKPAAPRTGLLHIDACRVSMSAEDADTIERTCRPNTRGVHDPRPDSPVPDVRVVNVNPAGRWPANVVLDESQADALDQQSGERPGNKGLTGRHGGGRSGGVMGAKTERVYDFAGYGDSGGASRFFYVAKASKRERPRTDDGTAHPTVKPLNLMRWLVRLVTPPGGVVLEPFAGSGTTVEACILEGFHCIAIEREADYLPLIEARISRAEPESVTVEPDLFDLLGEATA